MSGDCPDLTKWFDFKCTKEKKMKKDEQLVNELNFVLSSHEGTISNLKKTIAEKDAEIERLKKELSLSKAQYYPRGVGLPVETKYIVKQNEQLEQKLIEKNAEIAKWKKEAGIEGKAKSVAQELIKWHQGEYDKLKVDLDLAKGLSNAHLEMNREMYERIKKLEQKLAVVVEALEKIAKTQYGRPADMMITARQALAQLKAPYSENAESKEDEADL